MRLSIILDSSNYIYLTNNLKEIVQAFVYNLINDSELAHYLHNEGENVGKRIYKPVCFSDIIGECNFINGYFRFKPPITIQISSLNSSILSSMLTGMLCKKRLKLCKSEVYINKIETFEEPEFQEKTIIKTLSPITIYSTINKDDGKKFTKYFTPGRKEFSELIRENLIKKALAFKNCDFSSEAWEITAIGSLEKREKIITYKGIIIKAWSGIFEINGSQELTKIGYNLGFGSKNAQGFGLVEIIETKKFN